MNEQAALQELCIVNINSMYVHSFTTADKAADAIASALANDAEHLPFWDKQYEQTGNPRDKEIADSYRNANYQVMAFADFLALERERLLSGPPQEITEDKFNEMLNVLPPLAWTEHHGVEMFCMSEFYTGIYTTQCAHDHKTGKYYWKLVDYIDKTTWICNLLYPEG